MKNILIIPDSHCDPATSNERYTWLGNLIVDKKPDIIVNMGDMVDFGSLSMFDKGKASIEGKRYEIDCAHGIDAQEKIFAPLKKYNAKRTKKYNPDFVYLLGNHEYRASRAGENNPELHGFIDPVKDLQLVKFGWKVYPFKEIVNIEGVHFSHYFTSGLMDKPIGADNVAKALVDKYSNSAVQGHTHKRQMWFKNRLDGTEMFGLVVGCYFEHYYPYATMRAQNEWWRGLTYLKGVTNGSVQDIEFISMATIKKVYK